MSPSGFLALRDTAALWEMDRPDCDPVLLENTYRQFSLVNAVVSGWRHTYGTLLRPRLSTSSSCSLLDVGSGGGDVPRALARWARKDGLDLEITAIDPDERAHAFAITQPQVPGLTFRRAFSSELVAEGRTFDAVISNHLLHHLSPDEFTGLLRDTERLSPGIAVHSDISRHRVAYGLFSVGTIPLRNSYIRADGLTSIRRSYTPTELRLRLKEEHRTGWSVRSSPLFHHSLVYEPGGNDRA
ncbi:class I SAM-dependent methyltransferase [Arthrobacter sp. Br18]|uniref:class I SAM-dependent methyltransferase n=1 Tax=Arthrobacter sp. Br18 TaxID=1312954 RepID=UPI00047C410C|nr:class I SAM-dependent methyltransferase [Arthrobacter sp. Br18]